LAPFYVHHMNRVNNSYDFNTIIVITVHHSSDDTAVRTTCLVNGTLQFLDPQGAPPPQPHQLDRGDYVGDVFGVFIFKGVVGVREFVIIFTTLLPPIVLPYYSK